MGRKYWLIGCIVVTAFLLRIIALQTYPTGFTADEAAQGYTAYSILQTGHDEWGKFLPLNLRSFGDFKPPLYTYLTIPSIAIFGLTEFAVRFPSALFGTIAVLFTYLLARKLTQDERIGLMAAFLLAVSPWHLPLSRGAFEANLTTSLLTAGIYFFLLGLEKPRFLWLSSIFFILNTFSYHSSRIITPLIILGLIYWKRDALRMLKSKLYGPTILLGIFAVIVFATFFAGAGSRASDVVIFHPTGGWGAVADRRFEAVNLGLPDSIARVFSNKILYIISTFTNNYLSYFSFEYLFTSGPPEGTYGMVPGRGVLYLFEIATIASALYLLVTKKYDYLKFLCFWLLIAPIPAALAKGFMAGNREAVAMPAWQIISAIGILFLYDQAKTRWPMRLNVFRVALVVVPLFFFSFFLENYLYHAPSVRAGDMHYGWQEAVTYIKQHDGEYDHIVVSRMLSEPQAFLAFYLPIAPQSFQQASPGFLQYEKEGKPFLDQLGNYGIGKYEFMEIPRGLIAQEKTLYVGTAEELQANKNIIHKISYPNGTPAFIFVTAPTITSE